jgi:hypothetical protein
VPFFSKGTYHVGSDYTDARRFTDLTAAANQGYNVLHIAVSEHATDMALFDAAESAGVYIIAEFNDPEADVVPYFEDHPALLGWNIADDVEESYTPATLQTRYNYFKTTLGQTRVLHYISGGSHSLDDYAWYNGAKCCDVIACQSYPISSEELEATNFLYTSIADNIRTYIPFWGNNQTYAWPADRFPTASEARNMMYQGFVRGVTGLLWYTLWDTETDLPVDAPALWAECAVLNDECDIIDGYILNGTYAEEDSGTVDYGHAAVWKRLDTDKIMVIAVNTKSSSQNFAVDLSGYNITGAASNLLPLRTGRMSLNGTDLEGNLPAEDVQVYEINLVPTSPSASPSESPSVSPSASPSPSESPSASPSAASPSLSPSASPSPSESPSASPSAASPSSSPSASPSPSISPSASPESGYEHVYVDTDVVGGAGNGSSWANAYSNLHDALAGRATNLVSAAEIQVIHCRGTAADTSTSNETFAGYNTSSNYYIQIESDEASGDGRHPGYYSTSHYRIEDSSGNAYTFIPGSALNINFIGIQVKKTPTGNTRAICRYLNYSGLVINWDSCIFQWVENSKDYGYGFRAETNNAAGGITNCIFYNFDGTGGAGIRVGSNTPTLNIHNNTFQNCTLAHEQNTNCNVYNNIYQDNTTDVSGTASNEDYGLTDNASGLSGGNAQHNVALIFADKPNDDFHLAAGDTDAMDAGYDIITNQPSWWWTGDAEDIDGDSRGLSWDVGADQY